MSKWMISALMNRKVKYNAIKCNSQVQKPNPMTTKKTKHTPLPYDAHAKGLEYKKLKREFNDLHNRLNQVLAERIIAQNQRDNLLKALKGLMNDLKNEHGYTIEREKQCEQAINFNNKPKTKAKGNAFKPLEHD